MITSILHCQSKLKVYIILPSVILQISMFYQGITPIWYLYAMASVQLLQVINTSFNFPIYWFVGNFRETFLAIFCGWRKKVEPNQNLGNNFRKMIEIYDHLRRQHLGHQNQRPVYCSRGKKKKEIFRSQSIAIVTVVQLLMDPLSNLQHQEKCNLHLDFIYYMDIQELCFLRLC